MASETTRGYNPVSNPNPQVDPAPNGGAVMSQGHDGNIVRSQGIDMNRNIRQSSAPCYGEDCIGKDEADEAWD